MLKLDLILQAIFRPLPKGKNKKLIGLMKNEWRKIMTQFVWSQAKAYSYLINDISKDKKVCHKKKNYV